jgi:replication factor C subunit 2/4
MSKKKSIKSTNIAINDSKTIINSNYKQIPWIEKYRPKSIHEITVDPTIRAEINNIIAQRDIPNMILTGTPGIGKTTTLLCLVRHLYGKYAPDAVLELNASDDRGIQSINSNVINFCNYMRSYAKEDEAKYAQHKLIIFDEADNMTDKALPIISNLMDRYHKTTRFVFTCNTSSKIIESIQSRCKILRYSRMSNENIIKRLQYICLTESVAYKLDALEEIASFANGDMRMAVNILQLTNDKFGSITTNNVSSACDKPPSFLIKEIIIDCIENRLLNAITKAFNLKSNGFTCADIINNSFGTIKLNICSDINEELKMHILFVISSYMFSVSKTLDTDVQLTAFLVELSQIKVH